MATTGAFAIYEKKTGRFLEEQSYQSTTEYYLSRLKEKQEKGEITLYCCCSNRIEMKVSKKPHLYPANRENRHSTNCVRHPQYEGTNDYEKAWGYDEEKGEHVVRVESMIPSSKTQQLENPIKEGGEQKNKIYIKRGGTKRKGEATIFGLATKLNMMAWQRIVLGKKKMLPKDAFELAKHVYGVSNNIRLSNKKKPLSTMFHRSINIRDVQVEKDIFFIYMYYNDEKWGESDELFNGTIKDIVYGINSFKQEHGFYIDTNEFKEKLSRELHSNTYVIAGFAYKAFKYDKKLTLGNYCLIPTSEAGLFVESSYEKQVYEALYNQQRKFYKPYLSIDEYGGFVPDLIIEEAGKKSIIGEVFGINNDEEYEQRRREKIDLSKKEEFKSLYDFWKWDANKGDKLILPT
ncbi:hypothetical protein [Priestia endophytica]|uniref:hypothetical protein n=1 Tax=Priestia endophytica TaxID=135735 RepID=UPI002E2064C8|nr:hypothetical protein [Priestia endophytica]